MRSALMPLLAVLLILSGCATFGGGDEPGPTPMAQGQGQENAQTQVQPQSEEWRMQSLEKSFLEFREEQARQRAELQQQLAEQDQTLGKIREQIHVMEQKNAKLHADVMASASTAQARANAMPQASVRMEPTPTPVPKSAPAPSPKKLLPKDQGLQKTTSIKKAPVRRTVAKKLVAASSGKGASLYERALQHVQVGNSDEARKLFNEFLADNPKSPLVPNALYWLGETYYHDKRYAQSILTFKEVVRKYPKHNKAAASMLKAGYAYEKLGDGSNAEFYLRTLTEDYPGTEPARLAIKKLKDMGY